MLVFITLFGVVIFVSVDLIGSGKL